MKKIVRCILVIMACTSVVTFLNSVVGNIILVPYVLNSLNSNESTEGYRIPYIDSDRLVEEPENPITMRIFTEKGIEEIETYDFFDTKEEALKNPYIAIDREGNILNKGLDEITVRFYYLKEPEIETGDWICTVKLYCFKAKESFFLLGNPEEKGIYFIHANYNNVDKYIALQIQEK